MNKRLKLLASKFLRLLQARRCQRQFYEGPRPFVFTFHRIVSDDGVIKDTPTIPFVRTSTFASLMEYLCRQFQALSVKEIVQIFEGHIENNSRQYTVTFDDGWRDNYTEAFPILRNYKIPTTIFVSVEYVGSNKPLWIQQIQYLLGRSLETSNSISFRKVFETNGLPYHPQTELRGQIFFLNRELKKRPQSAIGAFIKDLEEVTGAHAEAFQLSGQFLNWEEIRRMSENGIEFGSHTLSHPVLIHESKTEVKNEICESKRMLEEKLQRPVDSFAYPDGKFDEEVVQIVKNAGYRCAFKGDNLPGKGIDLFRIPRIDVNENMITDLAGRFSPELFELELSSVYSKARAILKGIRLRR